MSMTGTPTVGDVGTQIKLTIRDEATGAVVNLSSFVSGYFTFEAPDNSTFTEVCGLFTDGTDGILVVTSTADTFSTSGRWRVQPTYTLATGTWSGTPETFAVRPLIALD